MPIRLKELGIKGIAKVQSKGHVYWYAWRGGPPLRGEPGTPEFIASYNEAIETRRAPDKSRFRSLVTCTGEQGLRRLGG